MHLIVDECPLSLRTVASNAGGTLCHSITYIVGQQKKLHYLVYQLFCSVPMLFYIP